MNNTSRMAALQAKGAGAPPDEPPMAPPSANDGDADDGMPPPQEMIPQIAQLLQQVAQNLPDDQKGMVMSAAEQLQAVFPTDTDQSGGMSDEDKEAYGESTPVK